MKMWRVRDWGSIKIESFEVTKQTEKSVTYLEPSTSVAGRLIERREKKSSQYHSWHPSFAEAREHVVKGKERVIESLRTTMQRENSILGQFKAMKEPEEKVA
jgi:hypothetical protein